MDKANKFILSAGAIFYLLFFLTLFPVFFMIHTWNLSTALVIIPAVIFYPALWIAPGLLTGTITAFFTRKSSRRQLPAAAAALFITLCPMHIFIIFDIALYHRYGYHINQHILNIFTTPGGFAAMGMDTGEIIMLAAGILILALLHAGILYGLVRLEKCRFLKFSVKPAIITAVTAGLLFLFSFGGYTYSHYMMNPSPLLAADAIPLYLRGTARSFYRKIGVKQPERDAMVMHLSKNSLLASYPQNPVIRKSDRKKYNLVWLTCESWAARLFTPEIMPETAKFAEKAIYFNNHYSGGNVTRQGVFSMFYALPGSYWHTFLAARRGPELINWLLADGYQTRCITSSKFTYPEFDQTVFVNIPEKNLFSDDSGATYSRDQRNVKQLLKSIEEGANSGKPFFSFMFFESTHHPYSFPKEATVYPDYIEPFNAVKTTAADGEKIFKRAANTARHLDICLAKVFRLLEEKKLLDDTIVIVVGDHGEEYYEKGRLGHSSSFNNEQTKTPLIIYYPGVTPGVYKEMSSHLDIVPMIAGLFGVTNAPSDYSCGINLLAPDAPQRRYSLIANWDQLFFAGTRYKSQIPLNTISLAAQEVTDINDAPVKDVSLFYREYNADLIQVQKDLTRFTAPQKKNRK